MQCLGVGRYGIVIGDDHQVTKYVWLRDDEQQTEYEIQHLVALCTDQVPAVTSIEVLPADAVTLPAEIQLRCLFEPLCFYENRTDAQGEELDADTVVSVMHTTDDIAIVITELGVRWTRTQELFARTDALALRDLSNRVLCVTMSAVTGATSAEAYLSRANKHHRLQVLGQVLGLLSHVRESLPGFRHNDLHLQNVLVSPAPEEKTLFFGSRAMHLKTGDPVVTIIDFGLSCTNTHQAMAWDDYADDNGLCAVPVAMFDPYRFFGCLLASVRGLSPEEERLARAATQPGGTDIILSVTLQQQLLFDPAYVGHVTVCGRQTPYGHVTPSLLLEDDSLQSVLHSCAPS